MHIEPGSRIRDYTIIGLIGEGGMGEVYLADDGILDRRVAIKILHSRHTKDPKFSQRFVNEARIQALLNHLNIVKLLTTFEEKGVFHIVMEYVEGITLEALLAREGALPEARALHIMEQLAAALKHAHEHHIIHRDVKPANIMVDEDHEDKVMVMDFGIARLLNADRLTLSGTQAGTVHYMSPEQVLAVDDLDRRTDVYSAGIVLYEMLTGKLPYPEGKSSPYVIQNYIMLEPIPDPRDSNRTISAATCELVRSITQKDRDLRPASIDIKPDHTNPITNKTPRISVSTKKPLVMLAGLVVLIGLIVLLWAFNPMTLNSRGKSHSGKVDREHTLPAATAPSVSMATVPGGSMTTDAGALILPMFYMAKYEVTQQSFNNIMGRAAVDDSNLPASNLTWMEAIEYCNRLSTRENLQPCYEYAGFGKDPDAWPSNRNESGKHTMLTCDWAAGGYRLPSEAEWLFAANEGAMGLQFQFSGSNRLDDVGWYKNNARTLRPVGLKTPNKLGLYDMSGNICEYVWDRYSPTVNWNDHGGPETGNNRVVKGGTWKDVPDWCAITKRGSQPPHQKSPVLGFRVARSA